MHAHKSSNMNQNLQRGQTNEIFHKYSLQRFRHFHPKMCPSGGGRSGSGHGSVEVRPLLKGNRIINSKEDNGGRKAHVKFSLLITTSHTMEALPRRAFPEMCRSLSCFQLAPSPANAIIFVLTLASARAWRQRCFQFANWNRVFGLISTEK